MASFHFNSKSASIASGEGINEMRTGGFGAGGGGGGGVGSECIISSASCISGDFSSLPSMDMIEVAGEGTKGGGDPSLELPQGEHRSGGAGIDRMRGQSGRGDGGAPLRVYINISRTPAVQEAQPGSRSISANSVSKMFSSSPIRRLFVVWRVPKKGCVTKTLAAGGRRARCRTRQRLRFGSKTLLLQNTQVMRSKGSSKEISRRSLWNKSTFNSRHIDRFLEACIPCGSG
mmetsp:Transcript_15442/g.26530  ORF Transcript_15442/g.26530 Transcript_15442/m.26530 type:complete len:231 (-) Transcript_15442:453-1145(-)